MIIEQIYTGCLAQGAYFIGSDGQAAIIDPLREVQPYIDRAVRAQASIRYVFETHFHADFVSGHLDLARKTNATIVYGPEAATGFDAYIARDQEEFSLGKLTIKVLHTPGHTMESACYLLLDDARKPLAVFTGDTLFIGDVGRPDLAQKPGLTVADLAGYLFDSLRSKIMALPDDVVVYPAHGAGSACGKNLAKETVSTIGVQKATNYALRADMTREDFIREVTDGLLAPPAYFPQNVRMNKEGYTSIDEVLTRNALPLTPGEFASAVEATGAVVLDVRHEDEFAKGHIPHSIFIGLDGQFAPWAGALIGDVQQPIALVAPVGREEEAITRLSRVGFDKVIGYLDGGFEAWVKAGKETDFLLTVTAEKFTAEFNAANAANVLDVRRPAEYHAGHLEGAQNFPLDFLNEFMSELDRNDKYFLLCAGGYRSAIACSILKSRGFEHLVNIQGGVESLKSFGKLTWTGYVCAATRERLKAIDPAS